MDGDLFASQSFLDAAAAMRPAAGSTNLSAVKDPRKAAEEFETFFLTQVFETMTREMSLDEPFGGGPGESSWRSFLNEAYAQAMVRAGGIGLADRLTTEIIALQSEETT